jgi:hypothetical protein
VKRWMLYPSTKGIVGPVVTVVTEVMAVAVTDEMVERGARAAWDLTLVDEDDRTDPEHQWDDPLVQDCYGESFREQAEAVLRAALGGSA